MLHGNDFGIRWLRRLMIAACGLSLSACGSDSAGAKSEPPRRGEEPETSMGNGGTTSSETPSGADDEATGQQASAGSTLDTEQGVAASSNGGSTATAGTAETAETAHATGGSLALITPIDEIRNTDDIDVASSGNQVPGASVGSLPSSASGGGASADSPLYASDGASANQGVADSQSAAPAPSSSNGPQAWESTSHTVQFASVDVGDGETLTLVEQRVTTEVEGLRARTVVDHIYYNPYSQALEGTFRYPLPSEASISYYAMFVETGTTEPSFFGPADPLATLALDDLAALQHQLRISTVDAQEEHKCNTPQLRISICIRNRLSRHHSSRILEPPISSTTARHPAG